MIPQAELEDKKARIVEVIGERLPLVRKGATFWACCPWHGDKRPSLAVSESRKRWRCFTCNEGGDTFDFIKKFHQTDFRGAIAILGLANSAGTGTQVSEQARARRELKQRRGDIKVEFNQFTAGLRYIRRLIAETEPLEREAEWFTAELVMDEKLDQLEAELRK